MSISNQNQKVSRSGDGTSHQFSFDFRIAQAADLVVIVRNDTTGVAATKTLDTHFIIPTSSVNSASGGNILFKFNTGTSSDAHYSTTDQRPQSGETIIIKRIVPFTQGVDLQAADSLPADTLEDAYDKLTFGLQQVQEELGRALLRPATDSALATLPDNVDLKGKMLQFNSSTGVPEAVAGLTDTATSTAPGLMSAADKTKLDSVESNATADQTAAEIRTLVESATDSNVFTDNDHSKLNAIEAGATADQTAADIRGLGFFDTSNDGASSGLDADLLDGQQGSYYQAALTFGISNTNAVKIDSSSVADDEYARFTANGLESRSTSEVVSDLGVITADSTATLTNKTIDASQLSGTVADARLPASISSDITGNAATATLASTTTVSDSTANTNFPIVFHDESNGLLDDTGALRYNPSTGELLVPKLTVAGTTTTVDTVTMNAANAIIFEGATADAFETTLTIQDPTGSDKTITLPNATGTILLADGDGSSLTSVNAQTLDSLDSTSFLRSDADDNKTSGNLTFEDNIKARFGTSGDLQIYHDGSNSFINDVGTGSVVMRTNGSFFQFDTPSTVMAKFIKDGAVELRHNNNLKFETTSTGATVTGVLTADGLDLGDDEPIRLGASQDLTISHDGSNSRIKDVGTGSLLIGASFVGIQKADGSETAAKFFNDGSVELYHDNSKKLETTSTGATTTGQHAINNTSGFGALEIGGTSGAFVDLKNPNSDDYDIRLITTGTGGQFLSQDALRLGSTGTTSITNVSGNSTYANFIPAGAVELFYSGNKRFETTSSGATITGTAKATTKFEVDGQTIGFTSNGATSGSGNFGVASSNGGARINADSGSNTATFVDFDATNISASGGDVTYRFGRGTTEGSSDLSQLIFYGHDGTNSPVVTMDSTGAITANQLNLGDNERLRIGASPTSDLQIWHDGTNSNIVNGTGSLIIADTSGDVKIQGKYGEQSIVANNDGSVELYHDNSKKLETTSTGATITGTLVADEIAMGDSDSGNSFANRIKLGAGNDLQLFHSGTASFISDTGTGNLFITGSNAIAFNSGDYGETYATFNDDGAVTLRHDDSIKFSTTSSGAEVTGDLTLTSTDAGATEDPTLDLYRNSASPAVNDVIGHITFSGENDASEKITYAEIETIITDETDGTEDSSIKFNAIRGGSSTTYYQIGFGVNQFHQDVLIESSDAGATENPTLDLYRNSASPADYDVLGHIDFSGENSAGEKIVYAEIQTSIADASDGTEGSRLQLGARYNGTFLTYYEAKFGLNTFNRDAIFTNDTNIIFEGATNDGNETTLTVVDPTSDNTIQLPDASGTVALQEQAYQAINAQTGTTYTTVLADGGKLVTLSNASAITLTIPPNSSVAYPVGTKLDFAQLGAGQVTVAAGSGVTVNSSLTLKLRTQYSPASCIKVATDTWLLIGDLE